jgi:hypothetical protein
MIQQWTDSWVPKPSLRGKVMAFPQGGAIKALYFKSGVGMSSEYPLKILPESIADSNPRENLLNSSAIDAPTHRPYLNDITYIVIV